MPAFTSSASLDALEALGITSVSLHTAYSVDGTTFELTGSGYARQAVTFYSPDNTFLQTLASVVFNGLVGATVRWLGLWTGSVFRGMVPLGGIEPTIYSVASSDLSLFRIPQHSYSFEDVIDHVVPWRVSLQAQPSGLNEGQIYSVIRVDDDTVQLSLTDGGAALTFVNPGVGELQRINPVVIASDGTLTLFFLQIFMR